MSAEDRGDRGSGAGVRAKDDGTRGDREGSRGSGGRDGSPERRQRDDDPVPGIARLAATAAWHTTGWAIQSYLKAGRRILDAAGSPRKTMILLDDARQTAVAVLRTIIELAEADERLRPAAAAVDVAKRVADAVPMPRPEEDSVNGHGPASNGHYSSNGHPRSLREEGEALLARSRDVRYEEDAHPAYERILAELTPDEGRILRLLLLEGPQPSIDVRTGGPIGLLRSELIAPGMSMIGPRAGCRYPARVPSYLNNLFRLGLIWFSRETLKDPIKYQVLEAQPEVLEAVHSVSRAKIVRRSIHLTPFGDDFCRVCLTPETAAVQDLPVHSVPPDHNATPQPPNAEESDEES